MSYDHGHTLTNLPLLIIRVIIDAHEDKEDDVKMGADEGEEYDILIRCSAGPTKFSARVSPALLDLITLLVMGQGDIDGVANQTKLIRFI